MSRNEIESRVLAAADALFYARGIGDVGVKEIRDRSGVSLNGLYGRFGSKDGVVVEYLSRRRIAWIDSLAAAVLAHEDRPARLDALFAWLEDWFTTPPFNGCAFINARAESSALSPLGHAVLDGHTRDLRELLNKAAWGELEAKALFLLVEGAIIAAQAGDGEAAQCARRTAMRLAGPA